MDYTKLVVVVALSSFLALWADESRADTSSTGRTWLEIGASASVPVRPDPFADYWNPGIGGTLRFAYAPSELSVWLLCLEYRHHGLDRARFKSDFGLAVHGDLGVLSISMQKREVITLSSPLRPYLVVGLGYSRFTPKAGSRAAAASEDFASVSRDEVSVELGLGLVLAEERGVTWCLEGRYLSGSTPSGENYLAQGSVSVGLVVRTARERHRTRSGSEIPKYKI